MLIRRLIGAQRALAMVGLALLVWPLARDFVGQNEAGNDGIVLVCLIGALLWQYVMFITGLQLALDGQARRKSSLALALTALAAAVVLNSLSRGKLYIPVSDFIPPAPSHDTMLWAILVLPLLLVLVEAIMPPWRSQQLGCRSLPGSQSYQ